MKAKRLAAIYRELKISKEDADEFIDLVESGDKIICRFASLVINVTKKQIKYREGDQFKTDFAQSIEGLLKYFDDQQSELKKYSQAIQTITASISAYYARIKQSLDK